MMLVYDEIEPDTQRVLDMLTDYSVEVVHDEVKPDAQRMLDILSDYKIEYSLGIEDMDFMRHFLSAKKSEGVADSTIYSYRATFEPIQQIYQ